METTVKQDIENIVRLDIGNYYNIDYGTENVVGDLLEIISKMDNELTEIKKELKDNK